MARVVLKDVTKKFKDVVAVDNVSLDIQDKEFALLVGPSRLLQKHYPRCHRRLGGGHLW